MEKRTPNSPDSGNKREAIPASLEKAMNVFYDYLKIEDTPEPSDVIFVLGGSTLAPTTKAAELYKAGYAPKIAFTGVNGTFGGNTELLEIHEQYREALKGVIPEEAILSEGLATNTLNEAQSSIPFLKERGVDPQKIILVSRPVHQRRAFATFKKQHPEVKYINCPADEPLDVHDVETRKRLVAEAERLLDYAKQGDIEKQEIPYEVMRAAATIRMELKESGDYKERIKPEQ